MSIVHDDKLLAVVKQHYPSLTEPELLKELSEVGMLVDQPAATAMIEPGQYIKSIPLILKGSVRILREDEQGNELFLYYLYPGETCAMSLTCCMANQKSEIKAITEEDTKMIMIPIRYLDEWTGKYTSWKNLVMTTYQKRFNELMNTIDNIAFAKMDERLIRYLKEKQQALQKDLLPISHQDIARELGTHREVISRLLKKMEKDGLVELGRNKIIIKEQL